MTISSLGGRRVESCGGSASAAQPGCQFRFGYVSIVFCVIIVTLMGKGTEGAWIQDVGEEVVEAVEVQEQRYRTEQEHGPGTTSACS